MYQYFLWTLILWNYMSFQACLRERPNRQINNRTGHIHESSNKEMGSKSTNRRPKIRPQKTNAATMKNADISPVQGNISRWRLGPLRPREAGGNKNAIAKSHKRAVISEEEKNKYQKTCRGLMGGIMKNRYMTHLCLEHQVRKLRRQKLKIN